MKKLLFLAAVLLTQGQAFAQEALLWKVSGKGGPTSYLFATGVVCKKNVKLPGAVEPALISSKTVYFEIPEEVDAIKFDSATRLPEGDSLRHYFSAQEYTLLGSFVHRKLNFDLNVMAKLAPGIVHTVLRNMLTFCRDNSDYTVIIQSLVREHNLTTQALESAEAGIAAQNSVPSQVYSRLLMEYVYDTDKLQQQRNAMMALYEKQDVLGMYALHKSNKELAGYEDKLLGDRNKKWLPTITGAISKTPAFICVGALQLGGEEGLISLLRKQGYTVTAVP